MKGWPTKKQWKGWTLPSKYAFVSVLLALVGLVVAFLLRLCPSPPSTDADVAQALRLTEPTGYITPANEPAPSYLANRPDGDDVAVCTSPGHCVLFSMTGRNDVLWVEHFGALVTLDLTDRGALVSAKLFHENGLELLELKENRFTLNPANYWRRIGKDRHELVIEDAQRRRVFSMRYLNPRTILIGGKFFIPGYGLFHLDELVWFGRNAGFAIQTNPNPPTGLYDPGFADYRRFNPSQQVGESHWWFSTDDGEKQLGLRFVDFSWESGSPKIVIQFGARKDGALVDASRQITLPLQTGSGLEARLDNALVQLRVEQSSIVFPLVGVAIYASSEYAQNPEVSSLEQVIDDNIEHSVWHSQSREPGL